MKWLTVLNTIVLTTVLAEFIPSHEWQQVSNDEIIPAGLHVRLNLDSGHREAKLVDEENSQPSQDGSLIVSFDKDSLENDNADKTLDEYVDDEDVDVDMDTRLHANAVGGEVHVLLKALNDKTITEEDLDDLNDLAHDLKDGAAIIKEGLNSLLGIVLDTHASGRKRESAARALGAAIRHNPSSQQFVQDNGVEITKLCLNLLTDLSASGWLASSNLKDEVLASRIIYVLGSLLTISGQPEQFVGYKGNEVLTNVYDKAGLPLKMKISDFVVDRIGTEWWTADFTDEWCDRLQQLLVSIQEGTVGDQIHLFENLCHLKQMVTDEFIDRNEFLEWISDLHVSKDEKVGSGHELVTMVKLNHHKFGNTLAGRKYHEYDL